MLTTPVNILWAITYRAHQMLAGIVSNIAMPISSRFAGLKPTSFTAVLEAKPDRLWQQEVRQAEDPSKVYLPEESSLWVVRNSREEIRSKDAWLVCGGEDGAKVGELQCEHLAEAPVVRLGAHLRGGRGRGG